MTCLFPRLLEQIDIFVIDYCHIFLSKHSLERVIGENKKYFNRVGRRKIHRKCPTIVRDIRDIE